MLKNVKSRTIVLISAVMLILLLISAILAINIGAVDLKPSDIFSILSNRIFKREIFEVTWKNSTESIVWNMRFPKVIVAGCVGAGLSLAGIFMQALTRNPLADPYILGISSGASTGAVMSLLIGTAPFLGSISLHLGAFLGAMTTSVLVFIIGGRGIKGSTTRLVLVGTAISAMFSALTDLIIFLTPDSKAVTSALFWMIGSFAGVDWGDVMPALLALTVGILIAVLSRKELDALLMGEELAKNYGVNVPAVKILLIGVSALLTGIMVSMSGSIGFVGLVIPHVSRQLMGATHRKMLPVALLSGAIFMIWADVIARVCVRPEELPVGVVTALVGAPFFLTMLRKSRYDFGK